ncbi:MAG: hypothetical protein J7K89_08630 [Candidatus Cloacimonetes bacterium]|nr:hypothetical protein [Candidatus Cloacimonadota bacterium]
MKKIIISFFFLVLLLQVWAGRYAGDFIAIGSGVRPIGMGGAFAAIADESSAIHWNPAGIAQLRDPQVMLTRAFLYEGLASYDNITYCQPLPNDVTIGFGWTRLTIDNIPVFNEEHLVGTVDQRAAFPWLNLTAIPDDKFTSTDDLFQFAFAKHLHKDIDIGWLFFEIPVDMYFGSSMKYIKRTLYKNVGDGTGFDFSLLGRTNLGMLVDVDWLGDIAVGVNFQNVGNTSITWDVASEHTDDILQNTKLGVMVEQPIPAIKSTLILSSDFEYVYNGTDRFGCEFDYQGKVQARCGYVNNQYFDDNGDEVSAGLSVRIYRVLVDYAFVTNTLGNTNRVGLRVSF